MKKAAKTERTSQKDGGKIRQHGKEKIENVKKMRKYQRKRGRKEEKVRTRKRKKMVELERKSAIGGDRVTVSQHSEAAASTPHTHTE